MRGIKTKSMKDMLDEYLSGIDLPHVNVMRRWEEIAGHDLYAITVCKGVSKGILYVGTRDSSARALMRLRKASILSRYNELFPSCPAKDLRFVSMY